MAKKSDADQPLRSPIDFHPPSNGEFSPRPPDPQAMRAQQLWRAIVERQHRRLGMSRRQFAEGACGMAAALLALNQAACGDGAGRSDRPGADGRPGSRDAGVGPDGAGRYDVDAEMTEDADKARERLSGDEFIFDVQVHVSMPLEPWDGSPGHAPPERALDFVKQIFVQSDTTVACLSGVPDTRKLGLASVDARIQLQEIIDRLAGPRLILHANADPERGPSELDYMAEVVTRHRASAWKIYPHRNPPRLDSDEIGSPFLQQARALGIKVIAAHRGISGGGGYGVAGSPVDVVRAAKKFPDLKFLVYHSGWETNAEERQPEDPANPDPHGVDRLIRALQESGIGADGNVYAELGTTWNNLMVDPLAAAHVLGKLLRRLGPDRVVWGTDSVFNGVPQAQIAAMRTFTIPAALQEQHGYPALTPEVRRKIFGLNGAAVYGVDPAAVRYAIKDDDVSRLKMAHRADPAAVPMPDPRRYEGPRTRRDFLARLKRDAETNG